MIRFQIEQLRYKRLCGGVEPPGFVHHMRPGSVAKLMAAIGCIKGARVWELGCGQGYLVWHLLAQGASHVIAVDREQTILDSIPISAYERHTGTSEFKLIQFPETEHQWIAKQVSIITMFIGSPHLVEKLVDLFMANENVNTIAFMMPSREFANLRLEIVSWCNETDCSLSIIEIKLSGSGEQRRTMILKKKSSSSSSSSSSNSM
jgi:precorrin-6B methylase 2